MTRRHALLLAPLALLLLALSGCGGGFQLRPVAPRPQPGSLLLAGHVASVQVFLAPELQADKVRMLVNNNVPNEMSRVLTGLGNGQIPFTAQIYITQFRNGFGPARMHTRTIVYDPSGAVVRDFESESMSMRGGSKGARLLRITQHNVQSIADAL
jgi:hypothetical protein